MHLRARSSFYSDTERWAADGVVGSRAVRRVPQVARCRDKMTADTPPPADGTYGHHTCDCHT
jgi:hypothetical protein